MRLHAMIGGSARSLAFAPPPPLSSRVRAHLRPPLLTHDPSLHASPPAVRLYPSTQQSRLLVRSTESKAGSTDGKAGGTKRETLRSLDSMLGSADDKDADKLISLTDWWRVPPRQDAPARQTSMSEGRSGRFIVNEDLLFSENSAGAATELGSTVQVPRVSPILSYVLLVAETIVFGTYSNIATMQGPDASEEFLYGLANVHTLVEAGDVYRLGSSLLVHPSPAALVVTLWGLATIAPELEAVMGYSAFLTIFIICGLTGSVAQHLGTAGAAGDAVSCGALAAIVGVAAFLLVHRSKNRGMEDTTGPSSPYPIAATPGTPSVPISQLSSSKDFRLAWQGAFFVAGSVLLLSLPMEKGQIGMQLPSLLAGGVAGVLLGLGQCPLYQVTQEITIPDGSMIVPENVKEMVVVVDIRSRFQRLATALVMSAVLLSAINSIHS